MVTRSQEKKRKKKKKKEPGAKVYDVVLEG
jgi:hypothetical protein